MSHLLISRSPDLKRLRDEGYGVSIRGGYLLVGPVPYVNSNREVRSGMLVSALELAGEVTARPSDHIVMFSGEHPCDQSGRKLTQLVNQSSRQTLFQDLVIDHTFSSKPAGGYPDYYGKMTTYAAILCGPARAIQPHVVPNSFPAIEQEGDDSVFVYVDTASSRAQISAANEKLRKIHKVAIVGLGGTGSYILDFIAKTEVREIHLFDGDKFSQHNAFRAPGATSLGALKLQRQKVDHLVEVYSQMRRHVIAHDGFITADNVAHLRDMDFVFLCLDGGDAKKQIVQALLKYDKPFIDVGMGLALNDETSMLNGIVRVTSSTAGSRAHIERPGVIPFSNGNVNDDYSRNIQVVELNALNAALAVIKWKKLYGFYEDLEKEHHSLYSIDGNTLINSEQSQ